MDTIRSTVFQVPGKIYVRQRARNLAMRSVFVLMPALAVMAFLAAEDLRFVYVGLIILFVIYPMAMSMAWLTVAASPQLQEFIRPQQWSVNDTGLQIDYFPYKTPDDSDSDRDYSAIGSRIIAYRDVKSVDDNGGKYICIHYNTPGATRVKDAVAAIPSDLFDPETWKYVRSRISECNPEEDLA